MMVSFKAQLIHLKLSTELCMTVGGALANLAKLKKILLMC